LKTAGACLEKGTADSHATAQGDQSMEAVVNDTSSDSDFDPNTMYQGSLVRVTVAMMDASLAAGYAARVESVRGMNWIFEPMAAVRAHYSWVWFGPLTRESC
jgi:hypothetical protein